MCKEIIPIFARLNKCKKLNIMEKHNEKHCLFCKKDSEQVPLVQLSFKGKNYWICPQHIPVLIHDPSQLEGMIPGAQNMQAG